MLAKRRGAVELPLRRRHPRVVFGPVFLSEQPHIEIAPFNFVQVKLIGGPVCRRDVLEQEHLEEPPHHRVFAQIGAQRFALPRELTLHAAQKDAEGNHLAESST